MNATLSTPEVQKVDPAVFARIAAMTVQVENCCGLRELAGLSHYPSDDGYQNFIAFVKGNGVNTNPFNIADPVTRQLYALDLQYLGNWRYAIFTQAQKGTKYGEAFARYIETHKLGTLIATDWDKNPNSGNLVKVWVWTVDHVAVKNHFKALMGAKETANV